MRRRPVGTIRTHTVVHTVTVPPPTALAVAAVPPPDDVVPAPATKAPAAKAPASPARGLVFGLILCVLLFRGLCTAFITTLEIVGGALVGCVIAVLVYGAATARQ